MAVLPILTYPDERLRKKAIPVQDIHSDRIRQLVKDMAETMYQAHGVGLAATQVDVHERVVVMDVSETRDTLHVLINPEIIWSSEHMRFSEEGCLSVPDIYDKIERAEEVTVRALNEKGESFELKASGLLAVCIQHELDHLQGRVFFERLSPLKRDRIKTKILKTHISTRRTDS